MDDVLGPFSVEQSGNVGQIIRGTDGQIVAWTTDEPVAQVIVGLLSENEEVLKRENMKCD